MKDLVTINSKDDSVLHIPSKKIKDPTSTEIQLLIPEMVSAMHKADGLGLAAPQIGVSLRLCIVEIQGEIITFINPQITRHSKDTVVFEEGCLSVPGKFMPINRAEKIQMRYLDTDGNRNKLKADGLLAIALQHELDHLDGILILDRAKNQKKPKAQNNKKLARYYA